MIALLQRERWTGNTLSGAARSFLVKVERKGSTIVPQGCTAHLWPTRILSVASEGQRSARNSTKSAMFR